jgi:hypothetical protein
MADERTEAQAVATEHTAGPWEASHRLNSIGQPQKGGRYVILQRGTNKREDFYIAEMPFAAVRGADIAEHEANARLIAAAPDLLNEHTANLGALLLLLRAIKEGDPSRELVARVEDIIRPTENVIAKAEGRS